MSIFAKIIMNRYKKKGREKKKRKGSQKKKKVQHELLWEY